MPRYKLYSKDGKSSRDVELRPSRIEIRIIPLLLCLILAIAVWCYASGSNVPVEDVTLPAETTDTAPPAEETPSDTSLPEGQEDAHPADV